MTSDRKTKWRDMSRARKAVTVLAAVVQISLAVTAWVDLARRSKSEVRGSKSRWAPIIGINFVGPLAYFFWGRRAGESVDG